MVSPNEQASIPPKEPPIMQDTPPEKEPGATTLRAKVAEFQRPILAHSLTQMATSFGGFIGLCAAMYLTLDLSYWLTLALGVVAAGFLVRIFIIQHDCGHGSFFRSRRANDVLGRVCSLFTLTPYSAWRKGHAIHHGVWNDLDRRTGGIDFYSSCLTVAEYRALRPRDRLVYRVTRHPIVANLILPPLVFLVIYRTSYGTPKSWLRERRDVQATNVALGAAAVGLGLLLGFGPVALVQLPVVAFAAIIGVWLFSVQHRFEDTHWASDGQWNFAQAALQGSSYLRLPRVLQWFTGNIGFHHVHHLSPRIPNYRLQDCVQTIDDLKDAPSLTLWTGLKAMWFVLWDEERGRMVTFADARLASPAGSA